MESGFIDILVPDLMNTNIILVSLLVICTAGLCAGFIYRAGTVILMSALIFVPSLLFGLVHGWTFPQSLTISFICLVCLQAGFLAGAGIAGFRSSLKRRFSGRIDLDHLPNRERF